MDKEEYENIWINRIAYSRIYSSSESSLESIICDASQDESTTQKQPWSEEIEALSNLPGGDIALALIPTLHGNALQKVLEEFQCVTLKNEDRSHDISSTTSADEIEQETVLADENRAADMTPGQLLAEWSDTCLLIASWLGYVEIVKALLEKDVPASTSDSDGSTPLSTSASVYHVHEDRGCAMEISYENIQEKKQSSVMDGNDMNKDEYMNTSLSSGTYPTYINSENNLESIVYNTFQCSAILKDESTTQKQPWSNWEIEIALCNLPGGDTALSLISTIHGFNALQKVLEEFQRVIINENRSHDIWWITSADKSAETTLGQLLAEWPDTCLRIAIWLGHVEIVKALLEKGVSVSTRDNNGRTPLHLAACTTSTKIVEELLKHGADPCQWDFEKKCTPLHCAAAAGCVATVKCLIKSGVHMNGKRSPLYYAVLNNAVDCVETLLFACSDNPQVYTKLYTKLLYMAVILGNVHCIKLLLDHGANVTFQMGTTKLTPLHLAAKKGNAECTKLLLEAGANTEIKNLNGQTAMHLATLAQSVETIKELIRFGANVDEVDNEGRTPLHVAVTKIRKSRELVNILIKADASVNKADKDGYTPLHIAAMNDSTHTVKMLLSKGGDVTSRTKDGVTALSFIVCHTPEILSQLETRLDQAISLHNRELGDVDCELRLNFQPLLSGGRSEMDLMLCLVEVGQGHMLKHPLCESFLHLKWKCIRKFFVLSLLFHLIFVAFFTGFVCATYLWDEKQLSGVLFWPVLTIICLFASKEIFEIAYGIYYYIKRWENWLQWSVIVLSTITLIPPALPWQHHVAALGILLAWIELMIVIGYFPMFGLYIQMFKRVSITFFKFLTAYFCLIIGFFLSFNVLHKNYKSFTNPLISMLKIVIMMTGELEFEDIFFQKDKDTDKDVPLEYSGTVHVMFLCFVILVTVILMNLMIGLAVSDIRELRRRAGFERLVHYTEVIARFENMLFSKLLDSTRVRKIIEACRKNTLLLHSLHPYDLHIRPNDPDEKCLPPELIRAINRLVSERKMRRTIFRGAPPAQNVAKESCKARQDIQQREQSTAAERTHGRTEETLV